MRQLVVIAIIGSSFAPVLALANQGDLAPHEACHQLGEPSFPPGDLPTLAEATALQGCESDSLYYGIGVLADPVKARKCAFVERAAGHNSLFSGSGVLMMVYANGRGVHQNLDIAISLACRPGFVWEQRDRVEHLLVMKGKRSPEEYDICVHAENNMMLRACLAHSEKRRKAVRANRRAAIAAQLSVDASAELAKLERAAATFFEARALNEIDRSGHERTQYWNELWSLWEGFLTALEHLRARKLPPAVTMKEYTKANAELNEVYARLMKEVPTWEGGTVERDGIGETQRKWLIYRDAWVRFGGKIRPEVPAEMWNAWTTNERVRMLTGLLSGHGSATEPP